MFYLLLGTVSRCTPLPQGEFNVIRQCSHVAAARGAAETRHAKRTASPCKTAGMASSSLRSMALGAQAVHDIWALKVSARGDLGFACYTRQSQQEQMPDLDPTRNAAGSMFARRRYRILPYLRHPCLRIADSTVMVTAVFSYRARFGPCSFTFAYLCSCLL